MHLDNEELLVLLKEINKLMMEYEKCDDPEIKLQIKSDLFHIIKVIYLYANDVN
ncbi:hypothetical protein [Oceanobacillus salinisoli]|uniref:hypothetical protein n=1 Tax=Oceanobacillus salinisoli TaxID=2678611 RepID=UPI0012E19F9B|nr:hypothetical protein [Oceanobacillus salinisoli]